MQWHLGKNTIWDCAMTQPGVMWNSSHILITDQSSVHSSTFPWVSLNPKAFAGVEFVVSLKERQLREIQRLRYLLSVTVVYANLAWSLSKTAAYNLPSAAGGTHKIVRNSSCYGPLLKIDTAHWELQYHDKYWLPHTSIPADKASVNKIHFVVLRQDPLEAILVIFGRRAFIFFVWKLLKKMKNNTTFVRMRSGDHLGDAKMSKKGTSLRQI